MEFNEAESNITTMCPSISGIRKYSELRTDGAALDWYDNYLRGMRAVHAELNASQMS